MPQVETFLEEYGIVELDVSTDVHRRMQTDSSGLDLFLSSVRSPPARRSKEVKLPTILYFPREHYGLRKYFLTFLDSPARSVGLHGWLAGILLKDNLLTRSSRVERMFVSANPDPCTSFLPSSHLLALIERYGTTIEQEPLDVERESRSDGIPRSKVFGSRECIGDTVEGLLANLARRSALEGSESLTISRPGRLLPEICEELVYQLGLDAYHPRPVLDCLCKELVGFISEIARERSWGTLTLKQGCIVLLVETAGALHIYDPDDADPTMWTVGT